MKKYILFFIIIIILTIGLFWIKSLNWQKNNSLPTSINIKNIMKITSPVFSEGEIIPQKFTCDAEDVNPELHISDVPASAKSLVLIVDDPDAPAGNWSHWLIWNINPTITKIEENSTPAGAVLGTNDFRKLPYGGPCPPAGIHRYYFRLYALDIVLNLSPQTNRFELIQAMSGHVIDKAEIMGRYNR